MTDTDDALVERVAKAMCGCEGICFTSCGTEPCQMAEDKYAKAARAAIAVLRPVIRAEALDEAAKVVEDFRVTRNGAGHAAAIRAMKEGK